MRMTRFLYKGFKLFGLLIILTFCRQIANGQCSASLTTSYPQVVTYDVCDLAESLDTLYYYSEFDVAMDGTLEHMKVYDYVLPRNLTGKLKLQVKGAKGGDSRINCGVMLYGDGGKGALVTGWVNVGTGGIPRGSTIRYVLGEAGEDSYNGATGGEFHRGGSGGGASAILYKAPNSTNWTPLMIAGGGGGGYAVCFPKDEDGVAFLYRYTRTGGAGGVSQSVLGNGGAAFYVWHDGDYTRLVSCGGIYQFTASEFWPSGDHNNQYTTVTTNDQLNFCVKISGGGGYLGKGWAPCGDCSGGMKGSVWTEPGLPLIYRANYYGGSCVLYSNMRRGGRGFSGGGAAFSRSTWFYGSRRDFWPGTGGGGGATGGAGAIGNPEGIFGNGSKPAEGGTSWVNEEYVSGFSFVGNNGIENGYGNFYFIRDTGNIQPNLSIKIGEQLPICAGTNVHMVATLSAATGSLLNGITNPVFTWRKNGQVIGTGTNVGYNVFTNQPDSPAVYSFNILNIIYQPGDVITCSVAGTDLQACGRSILKTASFIVPADNGNARSQVQAIAPSGNKICQAYFDVKRYGLASLQASAALIANIGNNNPIPYQPYYKWYINGERVSAHYTIVDTLSSIPAIYVADGDSAWCEITSNHCSTADKSNVIHFTVSGMPSTGGTIAGPLHPGPNTTNTYTLINALNAVSYYWVVTGNVSNIVTNQGPSLSFHIGTGNAHIVCYPQGACGGGDTIHFDVSPSNHIPNCQYSSPLVVSPDPHCAGTAVTISAPYDTAANHNNFDWYEWSTGANTRSITVTADGPYYVYLNGCKSETVVLAGIAVVNPSIGISIVPTANDAVRNYWCRQDGHRSVTVSSSVNLSAFSNVEYQWFKNGIRISAGINVNFPDHLDLNLNTLFYNGYDTITCKAICTAACGTVKISSNNTILPLIREPAVVGISITASATTVCSGQAIDFLAAFQNGGTSPNFQWISDFGSAVFGSATYSTSFTNYTGSPQTHTIYAKVFVNPGGSVGCLSGLPFATSEIINITVNPQPTVSVTASDVTGCAGIPISLSGFPEGGIFSKPSPYLGPSSTYRYYYTDNNGCTIISEPAIINVSVMPLVKAQVSPNDTICANQEVVFSGSGANAYSWTKGVIDGEPYSLNATDTFTVTGYGSDECSGERSFIKLAGGANYSLAIKSDGTLWAWGDNHLGSLGDSTLVDRSIPVQIGKENSWIDIAAGEYHSLALKSDGTLWSWGLNSFGELGTGTPLLSQLAPKQVGTATNWKSIAAGYSFSLGLQANGSLWAWGKNQYGQLGVNGNTDANLPTRVDAAVNWISIAAGGYHSMALKSDGTLWTWGYNFFGALGNPVQSNNIPYKVGAANNWVSIDAGLYHSLAIKSDGTLWAWGYNNFGQLGDGTNVDRYVPVKVGTDINWVGISGGRSYTLGLRKNGSLWSWGQNNLGQLGQEMFSTSVDIPIQLGAEKNWAGMTAGGDHAFGIKSYGATLAWGGNDHFQLGTGDAVNRSIPVMPVVPASTATVIVYVKPIQQITMVASPSATICLGDAITLTATGSDNFSWPVGITNGIAFVPQATDTVIVTGTAPNGCTSSTQYIITVNTMRTWYLDADHDGHYAGSIVNCGWPGEGYVLSEPIPGDCDDSDSTKWQSGMLYVDADGDGYTVGSATLICYGATVPTGYAATSLGPDCNDNNASATLPPIAAIINNNGNTELDCATTLISVTATGGLSYSWNGGATPITAANSFSTPGTYVVTVKDANGCTSQAQIIITQNTSIPATPGPVEGFVNVCRYVNTGTQLTYSVPPIPGATFAWIVPTATTLISGQGTNSITLLINTSFVAAANKQIRITAISSCGTSPQAIFYLHAQTPGTPLPITGTSTDVCPIIGTANTYTFNIASVVGASSYVWTSQTGTTVVNHPGGTSENDTTITVSFTNNFTTSPITVRSVNGCGVSNSRSLTISKTDPSMPGIISGPTNTCAFLAPNGISATYSVNNIAGNTYNWTVPLNSTGLTGQGTNSISFLYPSGFTTGSVAVSATNGCATGSARILSVNRLSAATPGIVDVILLSNCPDRTYSYSIAGLPANTASLQWTIPAGAVLRSGQGTTSITVSYPETSIQGTVTVQGMNNCSSSTIRSVQVKLPECSSERIQPIFAIKIRSSQPALK